MRSQYAGVITPPPPTITFDTGSITAARAGSYSAYLQSRNRAGVTAFSIRVDFTVAAGQSAIATIPMICQQPGTDLHEVILSVARNSTNPNDALVVATYPGYEDDGVTPRSLEGATITLSTDEHLALGKTLPNIQGLPVNPINGMRRYVDTTGQVLAYEEKSLSWKPVYPANFSTYVGSSLGEGGCDREIALINQNYIRIPDYDSEGDLSQPIKFWIVNNGNGTIPQGTRIRISVDINGADYSAKFAGLMFITTLGYVSTLTGDLDTNNIPYAGAAITYQGDEQTDLLLPKPLPFGSAYAFQVQVAFQDFQLNNEVLQGAVIRFYPRFAANYARYDEGGAIMGDYILPTQKMRRVVPRGAGLLALGLEGSGRVASYTWREVGAQIIAGLTANTTEQKCLITNNGTCFVASTIPATTKLRCLIGTADGVGAATPWSAAIALDQNHQLRVTVTYPTTIRTNYPDAIAGSPDGEFNGTRVQIYLQPVGGGNILQFSGLCTPQADTDEFTVGAIALDDIGSSLPAAASNFGLYAPSDSSFSATAVNGATSVFTAGNYRVAIAYSFENTITSIKHSALEAIYEVHSTMSEVFEHVSKQNNPHEVTAEQVGNTSAQWNADKIQYQAIAATQPFDRQTWVYDASVNTWIPKTLTALILEPVITPPTTGSNESALFVDASDNYKWKTREPNNGLIVELGSSSSPPTNLSWRSLTRSSWNNLTRQQWKSLQR